MSQYRTIPLVGTATARAQTTLVSRRLNGPFQLETLTVRFPPGCQNLLELSLWLSPDPTAPSSGNPTGVDLLREFSTTAFLRGDSEQITIRHQVDVPSAGNYLKLVAVNDDWYDHDIDAELEISIPTKGGV